MICCASKLPLQFYTVDIIEAHGEAYLWRGLSLKLPSPSPGSDKLDVTESQALSIKSIRGRITALPPCNCWWQAPEIENPSPLAWLAASKLFAVIPSGLMCRFLHKMQPINLKISSSHHLWHSRRGCIYYRSGNHILGCLHQEVELQFSVNLLFTSFEVV